MFWTQSTWSLTHLVTNTKIVRSWNLQKLSPDLKSSKSSKQKPIELPSKKNPECRLNTRAGGAIPSKTNPERSSSWRSNNIPSDRIEDLHVPNDANQYVILAVGDPDVRGPVRQHLRHDGGERARAPAPQRRVPTVARHHHLLDEAVLEPNPAAAEPPRQWRGDASSLRHPVRLDSRGEVEGRQARHGVRRGHVVAPPQPVRGHVGQDLVRAVAVRPHDGDGAWLGGDPP